MKTTRLGPLLAIVLVASSPALRSQNAVTPGDVALARKSIFSPESGATLPPEKTRLLDTNHDGVLTLEDLNGLPSSRSRWKTLFVAPSQPANFQNTQPLGSYANPFVLTESSTRDFYDQIRKITFPPGKNAGLNAEVIFLPGTYQRIELLLRNADSQPTAGKPPIKAVIDRFRPVRLFLRSLYPLSNDPQKVACFFGASQGADPAGILKYGPVQRLKTDGPDGGAPYFLQIQGDGTTAPKNKISGITVSGLKITCYRSGIDLLYASKIVLKNNLLDTLGSARTPEESAAPSDKTAAMYGTSAIGMARLCENILIKHNRIVNAWNRYNSPAPKPGGDPGLMHPFYIIDASNIVYLDNTIENSSGPQFKVVDLPAYSPDGAPIPGTPRLGRQVLINNSFLQSTDRLAGLYPVEFDTIAMIHDNSAQVRFWPDKKIYTKPSPPAANFVFLGNTWETKIAMPFLRRESVTTSADGVPHIPARFPNWIFEGNKWIGFKPGPTIVERRRGTPISERKDITREVTTNPDETIRLQSVDHPYPYEKCLQRLRELVTASPIQPIDRTLLDIVEKKEISGVSTDN